MKLKLKDGSEYEGKSFGARKSATGEVVFATGMVGYPEALTDPSFRGQILVLTFPLIGNYGVPDSTFWESKKIQVAGLIVCNYTDTPSHHENKMSLSEWLKKTGVPALEIQDTRELTQKLRDQGVMLGKIVVGRDVLKFSDPNLRNLVAEVSTKEILSFTPTKNIKGGKTIGLLDCGVKYNITRSLVKRGYKVVVLPWDTDVTKLKFTLDAVVISNGPGDPMKIKKTINNVKKIIDRKIPIFGICLGNQVLALATGGTTYKLKFGHRSQNQPVVLSGGPARLNSRSGGKKAYLTTQNHGFAVKKIPNGFREWFYNANDKTNEGIIHKDLPFMSVQFHPESFPGPLDTDWLFDFFLKKANL